MQRQGIASVFDVSTRWNVTDAFTLTDTSQANTDPQLYRVLGRTFTLSGRYCF